MYACQPSLFNNCLLLLRVYIYSFLIDHVPKERHLSTQNLNFFVFGVELFWLKSFQRLSQVHSVLFPILGIDQDILDKDHYELI
jgi:hypothetical protein